MMRHISLQMKILGLIVSLILCITILLTGIVAYLEFKDTTKNIGKKALNTATIVSLMPEIRNAFKLKNPSSAIQPLTKEVHNHLDSSFIVVGNKKGIRYSHPDKEKIGKHMVGGDNNRALVNGKYYISRATGSLGPSLRGKAPIYNDAGDIIGLVSVGFMIDDVTSIVLNKLVKISSVSLVVLILGIIGGLLLARNIRKDTLGLEPFEISTLYRDREAILHSITEGIIAINQDGYISMINPAANKLLSRPNDDKVNQKEHIKVTDLNRNTILNDILTTSGIIRNKEVIIGNRIVVINKTPIIKNGETVGIVASLRDKTEINEMLNTISEVKGYSEDLRAQTHEFTNKLYVLSGLLQLGHYDEAVELIQIESSIHANQNRIVFDQINNKTIQAILLGKISKASEKKVCFTIDKNSSLEITSNNIDAPKLITIIGNLIDNAFDAVRDSADKSVNFFITDMGDDIIIEISDSGCGIDDEYMPILYNLGFTTQKGHDRGYGLSSVKEVVDDLNGTIFASNQHTGGAIFTVFLPKIKGEDMHD